MSLYAIGDLHFSNSVDKPMCIFGEHWSQHQDKIIENWLSIVKEEDTVLILGDKSWATKLNEAKEDLDIIDNLPGRKIVIKGNHDYWWTTVTNLNKMYERMDFLQTGLYQYEDYAICGSRGWNCPNDFKFDENDEKIYKREINRLRLSLESAKKQGFEKIIVITHYPPTNDKLDESEFTKLYEQYNVEKVIYGHLHGKDAYRMGLKGVRNNVEYILASCDYINFELAKIID